MRVLILGGTTEASALARLLAGDTRFETILSLAGRTSTPSTQPVTTRGGGFGGAAGLASWLRDNATDAVIDATHPYADRISANAIAACAAAHVPLASVVRQAWKQQPGDAWQIVPSTIAAAAALGQEPRRVFLGVGRLELDAFVGAPQHHYIARTIDPPDVGLPPDIVLLRARGPFDRSAEVALLRDERIDVVVSKNAGGSATYAKIEAAREIGLPVVMIARPHKATGHAVDSPHDAVVWLERQSAHGRAARSPRGV